MPGKCVIYYATVVEGDHDRWAQVGEKFAEPVRVEGSIPLGKAPEFCCDEMAAAYNEANLQAYPVGGNMVLWLCVRYSGQQPIPVRFCPYCGASVELRPDLKMRAVSHPRIVKDYSFEIA